MVVIIITVIITKHKILHKNTEYIMVSEKLKSTLNKCENAEKDKIY